MRGHFLLRPHVCHSSNYYSVPKALKIALSLDTISSSSYCNPNSKRTSSSQPPKETISAVAGTALRGDGTTPRRPFYHSRPNHDADINVDDLEGTLVAHRTTNIASLIHPVKSDGTGLPLFWRPEITSLNLTPSKAQVTADATDSASLETPEIIDVGSEDLGPQAIAEVKVQEPHGDVPQTIATLSRPRRSKQTPNQPVRIDEHSLSRTGKPIGDYVGLCLWPAEPWSFESSGIERPWLDYHQNESGDGYSRLRAEILAFHAFMKPTPDESAAYKNIVDDVQDQVHKILPDNPIEVIGSQRTGLATSLSDLDFRLSLPEYEKEVDERGPSTTRPEARKECIRQLRKLIKGLWATKDYTNVEVIYGRIPIVSAVHRATQLTIQIQALGDSSTSREYVLNYLAEFPTLHPLYTLIKTSLEIRNLRDVHVGGLGAYSTFMLVVAALKDSEGAIPRHDIAWQLLSALQFYAETDFYRHGISVDPPGLFRKINDHEPPKHSKKATLADPILRGQTQIGRVHKDQPYMLCMQDPANPLNDLGCKSYNIKHVQALFREARTKLWTLFQKFDHLPPSKDKSDRWAQSAMLDVLVGADYRWFQSRRVRIARWGRLCSPNAHIPSVRRVVSKLLPTEILKA